MSSSSSSAGSSRRRRSSQRPAWLVWATKLAWGWLAPRPERRISSSRRWAASAARSRAAATVGSRRLSVTASRPQGPGCSSRTQPRTTEAVPYSGSLRARDRVAQGRASANSRRLEQPLADQAADQHQPAGAVQVPGEGGRGAAAGLQQPANGRLQGGRHGQGAVAQQQLQPVPPGPQPPGGTGPDPDLAVLAELVQGEEISQLALEQRGPVGP